MFFYGTDGSGVFLKVSISRQFDRQAQVSLLLALADGTTYQLPSNNLRLIIIINLI